MAWKSLGTPALTVTIWPLPLFTLARTEKFGKFHLVDGYGSISPCYPILEPLNMMMVACIVYSLGGCVSCGMGACVSV